MGSVPEEKAQLGFGGLVGDLREVYESGRTQGLEWRQSQLRGLVRLLEEKEEEIFDVLHEDLGKHRGEAFRDEVGWFLCVSCALNEPSGVMVIRSCLGWGSEEVRRRQAAKPQELGGSGEGKHSLSLSLARSLWLAKTQELVPASREMDMHFAMA
jgi:hypothetical protein